MKGTIAHYFVPKPAPTSATPITTDDAPKIGSPAAAPATDSRQPPEELAADQAAAHSNTDAPLIQTEQKPPIRAIIGFGRMKGRKKLIYTLKFAAGPTIKLLEPEILIYPNGAEKLAAYKLKKKLN